MPGLRICGKTGTAQVKNEHGQLIGWNYWFASFAPYENPRYAVVVMVQSENRGSGGRVCAPIAHDIYEAILKSEQAGCARPGGRPARAVCKLEMINTPINEPHARSTGCNWPCWPG